MTAAGYFTYECGNCFEPKAGQRPMRSGQPLAWFGIYERSYRFDHATGSIPEGGEPTLLAQSGMRRKPERARTLTIEAELRAGSEEQYAERIAAIHEWIRAGDVYQLNFTVPYSVKRARKYGWPVCEAASAQPVEYGAFLHMGVGSADIVFFAGAVLPHR